MSGGERVPGVEQPDHLFVYGTLRRGGGAPAEVRRLLERGADLVGEARIRGRLFEAGSGRYPALVLAAPGRWISGELHRLRAEGRLLRALDRYEGRKPDGSGLYRREVVEARRAGPWGGEGAPRGAAVPAWTYVYNRETEGLPEVEGGDWLDQSSSSA